MNERKAEVDALENWKTERLTGILANKGRYIGKQLIQSGYDLPQRTFILSDISIINQDSLVIECKNGETFTLPKSKIMSCTEDAGFSIGVEDIGNLSLKE